MTRPPRFCNLHVIQQPAEAAPARSGRHPPEHLDAIDRNRWAPSRRNHSAQSPEYALVARGLPVAILNPLQSARFQQEALVRTKTDALDALELARLGQQKRPAPATLSEKINRQMNRINSDVKADLKRFVATELLKKERAGEPVVLTAEQTRAARAPEPARADPAPAAPLRRTEPDPPRRSRSR